MFNITRHKKDAFAMIVTTKLDKTDDFIQTAIILFI